MPLALAFLIGSWRDLTGRPRCIFDLQGELLGPLLQLLSQDLELLLRVQVARSALFAGQRRFFQLLHFLYRDAIMHALLSTHLTRLSTSKLYLREFTGELGRRPVVRLLLVFRAGSATTCCGVVGGLGLFEDFCGHCLVRLQLDLDLWDE